MVRWAATVLALAALAVVALVALDPEAEPPATADLTASRSGTALPREVDGGATLPAPSHGPLPDPHRVRAAAGSGSVPLAEARAANDARDGAGVVLRGSVVDEDGDAVAFARVLLWDAFEAAAARAPQRTVLADGAGAFEAVVHGPLTLAAETDVLVPRWCWSGASVPAAADAVVLGVGPAEVLAGRVVQAQAGGLPLPDARIEVTPAMPEVPEPWARSGDLVLRPPPPRQVQSDAAGSFAVSGLPQGPVFVRVTLDGFVPWSRRAPVGPEPWTVALETGGELRGGVRDAAGSPLAGAAVAFFTGSDAISAVTGAAGEFHLRSIAPGIRGALAVRAEGHAMHLVQPVTVEAGRVTRADVSLAPERVVAGVVRDAAGHPVAGASLTLAGAQRIAALEDRPLEQALGRWYTHADADGRFRFDQLYAGLFRLTARDPARRFKVELDVAAGGPELEIVLDAHARHVVLSGEVRDGVTGEPVPTFRLSALIPNGSGGHSGSTSLVSDPHGRFEVSGLDPGEVRLTIDADGYAPWRHAADFARGEHRVDAALRPARTLRFQLVDAAGHAAAGWRVSFRDSSGAACLVDAGGGARSSSRLCDAAGRLEARGLPAGVVELLVAEPDSTAQRCLELDLTQEPAGELLLRVPDR